MFRTASMAFFAPSASGWSGLLLHVLGLPLEALGEVLPELACRRTSRRLPFASPGPSSPCPWRCRRAASSPPGKGSFFGGPPLTCFWSSSSFFRAAACLSGSPDFSSFASCSACSRASLPTIWSSFSRPACCFFGSSDSEVLGGLGELLLLLGGRFALLGLAAGLVGLACRDRRASVWAASRVFAVVRLQVLHQLARLPCGPSRRPSCRASRGPAPASSGRPDARSLTACSISFGSTFGSFAPPLPSRGWAFGLAVGVGVLRRALVRAGRLASRGRPGSSSPSPRSDGGSRRPGPGRRAWCPSSSSEVPRGPPGRWPCRVLARRPSARRGSFEFSFWASRNSRSTFGSGLPFGSCSTFSRESRSASAFICSSFCCAASRLALSSDLRSFATCSAALRASGPTALIELVAGGLLLLVVLAMTGP